MIDLKYNILLFSVFDEDQDIHQKYTFTNLKLYTIGC